jgi:hypothetical protein
VQNQAVQYPAELPVFLIYRGFPGTSRVFFRFLTTFYRMQAGRLGRGRRNCRQIRAYWDVRGEQLNILCRYAGWCGTKACRYTLESCLLSSWHNLRKTKAGPSLRLKNGSTQDDTVFMLRTLETGH